LYVLQEAIYNENIATYLEVIANAKVPIVKFDHRESGISVDICVNNDSGLRTGKIMREFVREYPPLKPLTVVLKVFLSQRRLHETYTGGIGSFVLSIMVVSLLQQRLRMARFR
jgi:non-canonical poly(A) RNA polymerase PAPD5/7